MNYLRTVVAVIRPYWLYVIVALVILGPLLLPGYVFAPDMVFAPVMPMPEAGVSSYVPQALLHYLSIVVPSTVLQKVLLCGAMAGAGIAAHRLLRHCAPAGLSGWSLAAYVGGLTYMVNPFVYSRFMAGQYYVLLGYALLPVVVLAMIRLWQHPNRQSAVWLACMCSLLAVVSVHTLGCALAVAIILSAGAVWYNWRDRQRLYQIAQYGGQAVLLSFILNCYWLVPMALGHGQAEITGRFSAADRIAFAASGDGLGVFGNILALRGFWGDTQQLYLMSEDVFGWWWVPIVGMWVLLAIGIVYGLRIWRVATAVCMVVIVCGVLLASGVVFTDWLVARVPLLAGYREPQKFTMIISLVYTWLVAIGAAVLVTGMHRAAGLRRYTEGMAAALMLLPLCGSALLFWGANGQLRSVQYPHEWYQVNAIVSAAPQNGPSGSVLFLPWHQYLRMHFTGVVSANPAPYFFTVPVVSSVNPEFMGAAGYGDPSQESDIRQLLAAAPHRSDLRTQLTARGIHYVAVAHEADYQQYSYIARQPGLQTVFSGQHITLYKVEK